MFKRFIETCIVVCLVVSMTIFGGCKNKTELLPADITEQIVANNTFGELNSLSGDKLSYYFQFKDTDVKRFSVLIAASNYSADTVAAFEVADEEKQNLVIRGISQYLTKLSSTMNRSVESEYNNVKSHLLMKLDDTIILVICAEPNRTLSQLEELGAKAVY